MKTLTIPRLLLVTGVTCAMRLLAVDDPAQQAEAPEFAAGGFEESDAPELYGNGAEAFRNREYEKAVTLFRQMIVDTKGDSNDGKRIQLGSWIYVAQSLGNLKRFAEAEVEIRSGLRETEAKLGPISRTVEVAHTLLVKILARQEKWKEAESECRSYLRSLERTGHDSYAIPVTRRLLVGALQAQKKYAEVISELRLLIKDSSRGYGYDNVRWRERRDLADALVLAGRPLEGLNEARQALIELQQGYGNTEDLPATRIMISRAFMALGRSSEAEGQLRIVLELQTYSLGWENPETLKTRFDMAVCLWAQKKHAVALSKAEAVIQAARDKLGAVHSDTKKYETFPHGSRLK